MHLRSLVRLTMTRKTPAYAYVRMSTVEQARGDSERRQLAQIERFLTENNAELIEPVFLDRLSSFNGKNVKKGAIKDFLERVKRNEIEKGSILIIESFDRISRQGGYIAHSVILDIIKYGIDIATLSPVKKYSINSENQFIEGIEIQTLLYRAYDESKTKSNRITEQHKQRRENAKKGKIAYGSLPFWIEKTDEGLKIKEEEANDVKLCLSLLKTYGMYAVTAKMNLLQTSSKKITKETVSHLLNRPAVCGDLQTNKIEYDESGNQKRVKHEIIHDYYPALISRSEFEELRTEIQSRKKSAVNKSAGRVSGFKNIFRNVMRCFACDAPMRLSHMKWIGGEKKYLVCTASESNQCRDAGRKWYNYNDVENAFFSNFNLNILKANLLKEKSSNSNLKVLENAQSEYLKIEEQKENIIKAIELGTVNKALVNRLNELEQQTEKLNEKIDELKALLALDTAQKHLNDFNYSELDEALKDENKRAIINKILKSETVSISISDFNKSFDFTIHIVSSNELDLEISYNSKDEYIDVEFNKISKDKRARFFNHIRRSY